MTGTSDWQLDLMVETAAAEAWVKANENKTDFDLHPYLEDMQKARSSVCEAQTHLLAAASDVRECSELYDKILAIVNALDEVEIDIMHQRREVEKLV